jgi:hypothetical protein
VTSIAVWKEAYDKDTALIYLLDRDLKIARCNLAWDAFALANDGEKAMSSEIIGTCVMDVVPPVLQSFYRTAYDNVGRFRRSWWHIFDCSSPTLERVFHMRIMPGDGGCFLTINTLISEAPAGIEAPQNLADYAGADGIAVMCSNCRRARRLSPPGAWEWIPELLWSGQVVTTFDLCDFCTAYHYHLR